MQHSTVKWFDAKKGYGFINHPDDGEDVFVHYSNITSDDDFKTLKTGQSVKFEMNDGPKGLHALNVIATDDAEMPENDASAPDESASDIAPSDVDPTAEVDPTEVDPSPSG
jgi:CspA family cold shock protein